METIANIEKRIKKKNRRVRREKRVFFGLSHNLFCLCQLIFMRVKTERRADNELSHSRKYCVESVLMPAHERVQIETQREWRTRITNTRRAGCISMPVLVSF